MIDALTFKAELEAETLPGLHERLDNPELTNAQRSLICMVLGHRSLLLAQHFSKLALTDLKTQSKD